MKRAALVLVAIATLVLGAALAPGASAAAPGAGAPPEPTLTLTEQDAWTPIGGDLRLEVQIPDALADPDATLNLVAYQPVAGRAAYERVLENQSPGSVLDQVVIPVADLPAGTGGARAVTVGVEGNGAATTPTGSRCGAPASTRSRWRSSTARSGPVARFLTMVVAVTADITGAPVPIDTRLGVAWTWPLSAGPSTLPGGSPDPKVTRALRPSGRLGRQAVAIARRRRRADHACPRARDAGGVGPPGCDDPAIAVGAAAVEDAAGRDQVVTGTYVPTNLPSLLAAGWGPPSTRSSCAVTRPLGRILATRPDVRTALADPVDASSLARLRAGASTTSSWTPRRSRPAAARSRPGRSCSNRRPRWYRAVPCPPSPATQRSRSCSEPFGPPALRAQRVLAALSVIAFEDPNQPRAITMLNPPDLDPPIDLLDALLTGLRGNPLLAPMTVDEVFALVPAETTANGTPVTRQLAAYAPPPPPVNTLTYGAARLRLDAFRSLAGPADPVVVRGERSLLVCQSATFVGVRGNLRATRPSRASTGASTRSSRGSGSRGRAPSP